MVVSWNRGGGGRWRKQSLSENLSLLFIRGSCNIDAACCSDIEGRDSGAAAVTLRVIDVLVGRPEVVA